MMYGEVKINYDERYSEAAKFLIDESNRCGDVPINFYVIVENTYKYLEECEKALIWLGFDKSDIVIVNKKTKEDELKKQMDNNNAKRIFLILNNKYALQKVMNQEAGCKGAAIEYYIHIPKIQTDMAFTLDCACVCRCRYFYK